MPSFTNNYTEPGTYVVINDDISTDVNTGLLSVCIIGKGKTTKTVNSELLELLPPIETPITPVVGTEYNKGTIIYYGEQYYKVTVTSTPEAAEVYVGRDYVKDQVLLYSTNYYKVTTSGTIDSAKEPEEGMSLKVGDIIVYDSTYYSVTTAGTVTTPIADWITANATTELTEEQANDALISRWLTSNATQLTTGVNDAIISYWLSIDAEVTEIHYKVS